MEFSDAKNQYQEAKELMLEAQVKMQIIADEFQGSLAEAIEMGMVKYNFPSPPQSMKTYDIRKDIRAHNRY